MALAEVRLVFNNLQAGWHGRELAICSDVGRGAPTAISAVFCAWQAREAQTQTYILQEKKPMDTTTLVMLAASAVLAVLYMARRRSRLRQED